MIIYINDQKIEIKDNTLSLILDATNVKPPYAVAINGDFVAQNDYSTTTVNENDKIDVVSPIFGG